jgi:putative transposase
VVELVRAGRPGRLVAGELGLAPATVHRWKAQDLIDRGVKPGTSTSERGELAAARLRIRELETELALVKQAATLFAEGVRPKAKDPVIAELASQGFSAKRCCRILGVAASGFLMWRRRSPSPRQLRFAWLTELVRAIHADSRGTYGWRRVNAELVYGHRVIVNRKTVRKIMRAQGLRGLPGSRKTFRSKANMATAADLVERRFDRPAQTSCGSPTSPSTRPGRASCIAAWSWMFSRRVVGWSIDSHQATPLVTNALGMAISNRNPRPAQTVVHSDHGSQYTSWAFTQRARESGLLPSMGTIGDAYDNAVIESFWARMQTELLDRQRWRTRVELANAIFEYLEIFHNRQRRHSALGWRTPLNSRSSTPPTSPDSHTPRSPNGAQTSTNNRGPITSATSTSNPGRRGSTARSSALTASTLRSSTGCWTGS